MPNVSSSFARPSNVPIMTLHALTNDLFRSNVDHLKLIELVDLFNGATRKGKLGLHAQSYLLPTRKIESVWAVCPIKIARPRQKASLFDLPEIVRRSGMKTFETYR
jgi:hypothetical protein